MRSINLIGVRGGVGATTLAALIARELDGTFQARQRHADVHLILGEALPAEIEMHGTRVFGEAGPTVFDCSMDWLIGRDSMPGFLNIGIVDNSYLAFTKARQSYDKFDGYIYVPHSGRALGADDMVAVLGDPLVTLPYDPGLQRMTDAGLQLVRGKPREFARTFRKLIDTLEFTP